jgi:hypothetical protein
MKCFTTALLAFFFTSGVYATTVGVAAIFRDEGPYLEEWIEYHKTIGVKKFWLYNHYSSDNYKEVLKKYIDDGIVVLEDIFEHKGKARHVQPFLFGKSIKYARGEVEWLAFIDLDEFIVPMVQKDLPTTLEKHFSSASQVYVNWKHFGTSYKWLDKDANVLKNLTRAAVDNHDSHKVGKSIVKVADALPDKVWYLHFCPVLKGKKTVHGDASIFNGNDYDCWKTGRFDLSTYLMPKYKYLRINHYWTRDENWWINQKIPRIVDKGYLPNIKNYWEQYKEFNQVEDKFIINFLKSNHTKFFNNYITQ